MKSDYEIDALKRLGGITAQKNMSMIWIGITERMKESMCLFHKMVDYPYKETPRRRYKGCRPISYYDEQYKVHLRQTEIVNYAISNAAHAILDIRMAKLCRDLRMNNDNKLELPIDSCCSNFVFDSEGRIQTYIPSAII